jgi:7-cyano-7-deazaguanine synthase
MDVEPDAGRNAVVLLSGGLDSATVLAIAQGAGFRAHALTFSYGQRHDGEIDAARQVAAHAGVADHVVLDVNVGAFGGSALTASDIDVPKGRDLDEMDDGIPATYVPARNTVFLAYSLAYAEVLEADDIFIGVNAVDYSGYPDCRPEFVSAFEALANLATKRAVEGSRVTVHAPLIEMAKADIVRRGLDLGVDYSLTRTCYDPEAGGAACGECDACRLRLEGFRLNGMADPAPYASVVR